MFDGKTNEIYIYLIADKNELIHTLAHEMGHALNFDHSLYPHSIMYPFVTKIVNTSSDDEIEVQKLCEKQNLFKLYTREIPVIIQRIQILFLRIENELQDSFGTIKIINLIKAI